MRLSPLIPSLLPQERTMIESDRATKTDSRSAFRLGLLAAICLASAAASPQAEAYAFTSFGGRLGRREYRLTLPMGQKCKRRGSYLVLQSGPADNCRRQRHAAC